MAKHDQKKLLDLFEAEDAEEGTSRICAVMGEVYATAGITVPNQLRKACGIAKATCQKAYWEPESMTIGTLRKIVDGLGVDFDSLMCRIVYDMELHPQGIAASFDSQKVALKLLSDKFLKVSPEHQATILQMVQGLPNAPIGTDHANASLALRHQVRDALESLQYRNDL